jgi:hypothetical protein
MLKRGSIALSFFAAQRHCSRAAFPDAVACSRLFGMRMN